MATTMATQKQHNTNFGEQVHDLTPADRARGRENRWKAYRANREAIETEARERAAAAIAEALERSADQIVELALHGETEQVRLAASRDLLDRFGLRAAERVRVDETVQIVVRSAFDAVDVNGER